MDSHELKKLFPEATNIIPKDKDQNLALSLEGKTWFIAKKDLSEREFFLLKNLEGKYDLFKTYTPWRNYLFNGQKQPLINGKLRFLYLHIENLISERKTEWQDLILSFFNSEVSSFWLDQTVFVIIDKECTLTQSDIMGIITAIDGDFETMTRVLIGLVWCKEDNLPQIFKEEKLIGNDFQELKKVVAIPEIALQFYFAHSTKNSIILQTYKKKLSTSSELITSLYKVGGNVTQASKDMYIHRNTLEYRIDKLQSATNLNLRKMDDLVFSYLIIS